MHALHYSCGRHTVISPQDLADMRARTRAVCRLRAPASEVAERNLLLHARALDGGAIVLHS